MIRALIFDFDGLILDTETPLIDGFADVHAAHEKPFDRELFIRSVGHASYAFDPWKAFDADIDRTALEKELRYYRRIRELAQPILPGIVSLMDAAQEQSLPIALASNSNHAHCEGHLARIGLLDRFAFIGCREDVPSPKPEPDLYRLAVNQFGLRPHEAIAFEDSHAGSLAAKRAGLWCVVVPNPSSHHHDVSHADLRIASLAEVTLQQLSQRFESLPSPRQ
ncbi:MAG TPA: HAD-IA family hydrolase [Opitutaceae bacterium]|nr:HAD-IA family hydrolase [Opitutaceae bacterium]